MRAREYKLSPETVNPPARSGVPEIQVFGITLKSEELSEAVLRCIDKAIPFPIFYELTHGNRIRTTAAYKRPSESDTGKWVVDAYFETPWKAADAACEALPVTEKNHWKERISRKLDQAIERLLMTADPMYLDRICEQARSAALESLGLAEWKRRIDVIVAQEASLAKERQACYQKMAAHVRGGLECGYVTTYYGEPMEVQAACRKRQTVHEEQLLA